VTFIGSEEIASIADGFDELIEGSCADAPEVGFEFCEGHFDWVQIGAVGRQKEEPASFGFQRGCSCGVFMGAEIVEDDDGSRVERGRELCFDICGESRPVHGSLDDPGRDQGVRGQTGDEGLGAPFSEGRGGAQAFALGRSATQADQVGLDGGFINEDQPARFLPHPRLTAAYPGAPGAGDIGALSLVRDQ